MMKEEKIKELQQQIEVKGGGKENMNFSIEYTALRYWSHWSHDSNPPLRPADVFHSNITLIARYSYSDCTWHNKRIVLHMSLGVVETSDFCIENNKDVFEVFTRN